MQNRNSLDKYLSMSEPLLGRKQYLKNYYKLIRICLCVSSGEANIL